VKIQGSSFVVTGAGQGLGAEVAMALAARGARVVLVARGSQKLEEVVHRIRSDGGKAFAFAADIGDKGAPHAIAAFASELAGPIDGLIHNASTLGPLPMPLLLDTACEDFQRVLDVNLLGPFRLSKVLVGSMALRGHGLVVHITSDASVESYPTWGAYSVSKAALDHLGRVWAKELAKTAVRFVTIDPGEMNTQMHADAMPAADKTTLASPSHVARRVVEFLARGAFETGARVELARALALETALDTGTQSEARS
jgi:NAD(P)-dependent dehydrogenase (short-subunit alcohol dehydrogenase family)